MPILNIPDGEIYYEVHGSGFPLMIFAPGGLRSELAFWRHSPSNPTAPAPWMDPMAVLSDKYQAVATDQRKCRAFAHPDSTAATTGTSTPPITWHWPIIS